MTKIYKIIMYFWVHSLTKSNPFLKNVIILFLNLIYQNLTNRAHHFGSCYQAPLKWVGLTSSLNHETLFILHLISIFHSFTSPWSFGSLGFCKMNLNLKMAFLPIMDFCILINKGFQALV